MDQIRSATVNGYDCTPDGGVETGGILFGTQKNKVVRIMAWRPIACEYAKGPSFLLSDSDEAALAEALESWRDNPELAALEPVGWYHSHTRSEVLLSDADLKLFNRFFPLPWQVALVVRPFRMHAANTGNCVAARAGFFFRAPDGSIQSDSSYREFPLLAPESARVESKTPEKSHLSIAWKWNVAALIALMAIAFGVWRAQFSRQGFSLSASDQRGRLHVAWDRKSRSIRNALHGSLKIDDGGAQTDMELTAAELRSSSITFTPQSGDVVVRISVELPVGPPVAEVVSFAQPRQSGEVPPVLGRISWTGRLPKNGRLVVKASHASLGSLSTPLPAAAARVSVYPADSSMDGVTLYTPDPIYAEPQIEPAGKGNGWRRTTYTFDARRAAEIRIVEQPRPQNGYRLVLRSETKLSMIVIEWRGQ